MSEDADAYGERGTAAISSWLTRRPAASSTKPLKGHQSGCLLMTPPYLGMAVGDRTEGWVLLCAVFSAGLIAQHWCEECDGWHTITKKSAQQFLGSLS